MLQIIYTIEVNYNTVKHDPLPVTKSSKVRPMSSVVQNEIPVPQLTQHEIKAGLQKNNYRQGNENVTLHHLHSTDSKYV